MRKVRMFVEEKFKDVPVIWPLVIRANRTFRRVYEPIRWMVSWKLKGDTISNIRKFESRKYSQSSEDGIIQAIFKQIGTTNKISVELGAQFGEECNTHLLREQGWNTLGIDAETGDSDWVKKHWITAENIAGLLKKYGIPREFDLLSIDIDGNDYWVWKALDWYRPRVAVIEFNGSIPLNMSLAIPYNPKYVQDKNDNRFRGASLLAMVRLGIRKGYTLVGVEEQTIDGFYIRNDLIKGNFSTSTKLSELALPPRRGRYLPTEMLKRMVEIK